MNQVQLTRAQETALKTQRDTKDGLVRELKISMRQQNVAKSLEVIALLLRIDGGEKNALKALRKLLLKDISVVFDFCAWMANNGLAPSCERLCKAILDQVREGHSFLNLLAAVVQKQGRIKEALELFDQVVSAAPRSADYRSNRGNARISLGLVDEAIKDLDAALILNPRHTGALLNRAVALFRKNLVDDALADIGNLLRLEPRSIDGLTNKAFMLLEKNRLAQANEILSQVINIDPNDSAVIRLGIEVEWKNLNLGVAREYCERGLNCFPEDSRFAFYLAITEMLVGRDDRAFNQVKALVSAGNRDLGQRPLLLGAKLLSSRNQAADCERWLEAALAQSPDDELTNFVVGNHRRRMRDHERALNHFRKSRNLILSTGFELEALYLLGRRDEYLARHYEIIDQGISSVLAGTLATHASIEYDIDVANPFCSSPLDFTSSRMLDFSQPFFSEALEYIEAASSFRPQLLLANGDQTHGNLFQDAPNLRSQLEKIIKEEVVKFCRENESSHAMFLEVLKNENLMISAWAISMRTSGFLESHIHERGWISGTIYLKTPPKGLGDEGNLVFSTTGSNFPAASNRHLEKTLEVLEGQINLFPSSLFHRTLPFEAGGSRRVCIAFDVFPSTIRGVSNVVRDY